MVFTNASTSPALKTPLIFRPAVSESAISMVRCEYRFTRSTTCERGSLSNTSWPACQAVARSILTDDTVGIDRAEEMSCSPEVRMISLFVSSLPPLAGACLSSRWGGIEGEERVGAGLLNAQSLVG